MDDLVGFLRARLPVRGRIVSGPDLDGGVKSYIDYGPPCTEIHAELVEYIADGRSACAELTPGPPPEGHDERPCRVDCHCGHLLRLRATDRTVVYRLVEYKFEPDCYVAVWPD